MFDNSFQKFFTSKNIVFLLIAILFIVFVTKVKDVAILFFASFVISCSLNPLVDKLSKKMNRSLASGIVILGIILILSLFFVPLIGLAGHEIKSFIDNIPQYFDNVKEFLRNTPIINKSQLAQIDIADFISSTSGVTSSFVNKSINASANLASGFIYLLAGLIIIYYFLADKEQVKAAYLKIFPEQLKQKADDIIETISKKIGGYVVAQIVTMSSVGLIMALGLMLLKVEYAILLGLLTAILDLVPVVGPGIALGICLLTAYKSGPLVMILILVVFGIAQLAENNFVRPYIFGKFLDLHPLIIYLFLFITAQHLGIVGVIFAPAIAATVCVLFEELYIKNIN